MSEHTQHTQHKQTTSFRAEPIWKHLSAADRSDFTATNMAVRLWAAVHHLVQHLQKQNGRMQVFPIKPTRRSVCSNLPHLSTFASFCERLLAVRSEHLKQRAVYQDQLIVYIRESEQWQLFSQSLWKVLWSKHRADLERHESAHLSEADVTMCIEASGLPNDWFTWNDAVVASSASASASSSAPDG